MAKNSITDYSKTAASNTDIQSVDIDEGCLPSGINNAIRELMADLADMNDGTVSLTSPSFAAASLTGNLSFGDNDKAIFGAGSDLQIYHDGTHSYVRDEGTGGLILTTNGAAVYIQKGDTETSAEFDIDGAVKLRYDNAQKFATTSTGIDVNGTVTADGLTVDGSSAGTVTAATFTNTTSADGTRVQAVLQNVNNACNVNLISERVGANFGADFIVETSDTVDGTDRQRLRVAETGDISFYEDTGTTAKLFWDASAESLGIGTSSVFSPLHLGSGHSAPSTSGNMANNGLTISNGIVGRAIQIGVDDVAQGAYIQSGYVNNSNVANNLFFYNGASRSMTIDSSGRVGIGTSSPTGAFFVAKQTDTSFSTTVGTSIGGSSSTGAVEIFGSTTGASLIDFSPNDGVTDFGGRIFYSHGSDYMAISTNNTERMRIDSSGKMQVAKTTNSYTTAGVQLGNYASNSVNDATQFCYTVSGGNNIYCTAPVNGGQIAFYRQDTGGFMGLISNGPTNTVTYATSSDYRLKENVTAITDSVERLKQLNPSRFNFIADADITVDGFLAHEAATVVPEAVTGEKDAVDADGNPKYQGIDQAKLVPLLTAALQEAITKIEDLEARVATLEGN